MRTRITCVRKVRCDAASLTFDRISASVNNLFACETLVPDLFTRGVSHPPKNNTHEQYKECPCVTQKWSRPPPLGRDPSILHSSQYTAGEINPWGDHLTPSGELLFFPNLHRFLLLSLSFPHLQTTVFRSRPYAGRKNYRRPLLTVNKKPQHRFEKSCDLSRFVAEDMKLSGISCTVWSTFELIHRYLRVMKDSR